MVGYLGRLSSSCYQRSGLRSLALRAAEAFSSSSLSLRLSFPPSLRSLPVPHCRGLVNARCSQARIHFTPGIARFLECNVFSFFLTSQVSSLTPPARFPALRSWTASLPPGGFIGDRPLIAEGVFFLVLGVWWVQRCDALPTPSSVFGPPLEFRRRGYRGLNTSQPRRRCCQKLIFKT